MPTELLDYSYDRLTPAQIRAAGRAGVIRYVASGRPLVSASRAEVDGYRAAGLTFTAVWQNGKDRALTGRAGGLVDAADAYRYCAGLAAGAADPVYFAVDFDAQPAHMAAVTDYICAAADVLGWHRTGAYGGAPVLEHLRAATPLGLFWQTVAWSNGRVLPYANLLQYAHDQLLAGARVDYDRALTTDYGQWDRMALKSSARGTAPVLWVVIHTAEGPYDDDPANPTVDPGSVDNLRNFFADPNTLASSHAGCDDDQLSDGWVPYNRAAWTLRDGNAVSDNLEMCGRAGWTRAQWLGHRGMIRNAARWAAGRCRARGIPPRRLSVAQVAARNVAGIIDHNTYTVATGDGSHWDVGPGFPWDVFMADVALFSSGQEPETDMPLTPADADLLWNKTTFKWPPDGSPSAGKPYSAAAYVVGARVDAANAEEKAAAAATKAAAAVAAVERMSQTVATQSGVINSLAGQVAELTDRASAAVAKLAQLAEAAGGGVAPVAGDVEVSGTVHLGAVPSGP